MKKENLQMRADEIVKQPSFKIVMVGDQSVGKTHILHQYVKGESPKNVQATLGVDFL